MHDGKFLHLPVVDRGTILLDEEWNAFWPVILVSDDLGWLDADGNIVAVIDVIHITHAAVATVSQAHVLLGLCSALQCSLCKFHWLNELLFLRITSTTCSQIWKASILQNSSVICFQLVLNIILLKICWILPICIKRITNRREILLLEDTLNMYPLHIIS
jgi:hypothetical protein